MALGCRERFGTDLAISTTGLAGPGGAEPGKPIGLVYVGLAWAGGVRVRVVQLGRHAHRDPEPHREARP